MTNVQSKLSLSTYKKLVPAKYVSRITMELQRTFLVVLSLLKTHRRKAILLSLGPSTILKFITVMLPIIKLLPPTIKAIRTLGYFTSSGRNGNGSNNHHSNSANALANREANAATAANGVGMSMDELNEILWTPAEDMYWERVNAMVTRFGLCKTLGITLAGVRPGRVEVIMPFRAEVSGEGGAFHASLLPTLIAMTSQLTGMTLLPRHFTLKPIDFKCNILSDCDASTYLLVSRGAVVVRGDHSITVKVEILKASGFVPGSTEIVSSSPDYPSQLSWRGWFGSSSSTESKNAGGSASTAASLLVPGTGIERSKFVVCASGMQTSVVVRAGTDTDDEEEKEMVRLRKEREERLKRSSSSSSSSSLSLVEDPTAEDSIILGDSFQPLTGSTLVKPASSSTLSSSRPMSPTRKEKSTSSTEAAASSFSMASTSASTGTNTTTIKSSTTTTPISYAAAVSQTPHQQQPSVDHPYEETSDTEAWRK
ncbi:hypothetical protein BGZ96_010325 [Linnemannia gamsii]|uniref:Thioesterase domain-containing protein n=1 Tax=Linnemannia gamsii TaxID=64522 RepID=A0ABQ7KCP8_9FUNG|nr:hypothetical protein BGZ96_010325 [Linnemannia gamsii]